MTELSGGRGTGVLSLASKSCPSPTIDGGDDDLEDSVSSSLQVWFDTEVLEAHECNNSDAIATTVQHSRTAFRSDVQIEPHSEG